MANQQTVRPWFRLASMNRPAPPQASAPEAQPPTTNTQSRPQMRPTFASSFRPQTTQPQEPAPAAPPPLPPVSAPPPPPPSSPVRPATTTTSVQSSPINKSPVNAPNSSSLPSSPIKGSPTKIPVSSSSYSVPPSPKLKTPYPTTSAAAQPKSPPPKIISPALSLPGKITNSPLQPTSPSPKITNLPPQPTSPPRKITNSPLQPASPPLRFTNSSWQPSYAGPNISPVQNSWPTTATSRVPTPPPPTPPKVIKQQAITQSPPQSPKIKYSAPPPSPLALPPSMLKPEGDNIPKYPLEPEQKTVFVHKSTEKPKPSLFNEDSQNAIQKPSFFHGHEKGSQKKKNRDTDDLGMRVITIAGENRGAFMELTRSSQKKHGHFEGTSHRLASKHEESADSSSKSHDGKSNKKANATPLMNAYMNSNVQGVNNSIVFDTSYTNHDPGVHFSFSRKPNGDHKMFHFKDNASGHHHN